MSVDATDGRPLHLVQLLLREQLLVSADILASFLPTAALATARVVDPLLCEIYITRGNIASARLQHSRAANFHATACLLAKQTPPQSHFTSVDQSPLLTSADPLIHLFRSLVAAAQLNAQQGNHDRAILVWEQLLAQNAASITAADCVCAARLYRSRSNISAACNAYARGLNLQCAALEIIIGLLECGKPLSYVTSIIRQSPTPIFDILPFFARLLEAHAFRLKHDYGNARIHFDVLHTHTPCSDHLLHHLAVTSMEDGFAVEAQNAFKRLREIDPFFVDGMDTYGSIIKLRGTSRALRALTIDLFAIDSARPEPWCVAAMHAELEGDRHRALQLVDKAIAVDSEHVFSYLLRGTLMLTANNATRAVAAFSRALQLNKDHSAYQGLVQAQIQLDDMQRALAIATEAAQLMPRSSRALALVGLVLSCDSAQQRKARRVLEQALALRPRCIEAVLALAELDNNEGHHDDAVKRLKEQLIHDVSNAEFIYVKLGEISMKDKPSDAIDHFRAALAINQFSESARSGLTLVLNRQQPNNNSSNARSRSPSPLT